MGFQLFPWLVMVGLAATPSSSPCPAKCPSADQLRTAAGGAEVQLVCQAEHLEVRIDFGRGRTVSRDVPATAAGCDSLLDLVALLSSSVRVTRVPLPSPAPTSTPPPTVVSPTVPAPPPVPTVDPPRTEVPPPDPPPERPAEPVPEVAPPAPERPTVQPEPSPPNPPPVSPSPSPSRGPALLALDVGGGVQTAALVGLFRARVSVAPFEHVGFLVEGGLASTATLTVNGREVQTTGQVASLGVVGGLRPLAEGGVQAAATVGLEHIWARQVLVDEAVGVVFGLRAEWVYFIFSGVFLRASFGLDLRPRPWEVSVGGASSVLWAVGSVAATVSVGFNGAKLWGF